ncbi:GatB/YqeY domain-containing protein [bacterium]|nr:GatB/YqeY domain-containing protein [bacterium]
MDYEQRISGLMKEAMKAKNKPRLEALRAIKAVILTERTKDSSEMTDDRAIKALSSYRKKMDGAAQQYREAGRTDLAEEAEGEVAVLDELLPQRLSDDELLAMIDEIIAETGASGPAEMGKVMGPLMKKTAGRADGNAAKQLVMKRLGAGQ